MEKKGSKRKLFAKSQEETNQTADAVEEDFELQDSKGKTVLNRIINVILVVAIIIAAFCTYTSYVSTSGNGVPNIFGLRIMSIQTESMYPTLEPGDMIFDSAIKNTGDLAIGDVVTYWTVINGERVLNTHRITQIYDGGGYLIFETKGDNNTVTDSLTVHESELVGQWKGAKVKGLGKVFDYLQTSKGFLIVVVIPVAIFFLYHLIQFFRVLFEYNNIKNRLMYEQQRGKNEDFVEEEKKKMASEKEAERARLEAELRAKIRAELLTSSAPAASPAEEDEAARKAAEEAAAARKAAEERAAMEAEAKAAMEAEIRAKIKAEMEAEANK